MAGLQESARAGSTVPQTDGSVLGHEECMRRLEMQQNLLSKLSKTRSLSRVVRGLLMSLAVILLLLPSLAAGAEAKATGQPKQLPKMLDIGAKECIPCKMMIPLMEELEKDYTESLIVEFIDVWKNPNAARPYGIRGIPTQIFYDASGKELTRHMGYISKEGIIKTFKNFGIEIKKNSEKGR
jgi:thioredoxin 1